MSLVDSDGSRRRLYRDHALGLSPQNRPHITGYQRATIFYSKLSVNELAKAHHCHPSTIRRIQASPLAACGITSRQCKKLINDLRDSSEIRFYTEVSSILKALPPLPERIRSGKRSKISELHKSWIRCLLVAYPDLYLDELVSFLVFFNPQLVCSISTLSRTLKKMGYGKRVPNRVLQRADEMEIVYFAKNIKSLYLNVNQLVFLDEACNSRGAGMRNTGWAPSGITPLGTSHSTGIRTSLCCAISVDGVLSGSLFEGGLNKDSFAEIMQSQIIPCMNRFPNSKSVLILDNCRAHDIDIKYIWETHGIKILFLPPYCPHLNPIERYFSVCKSLIRRLVYTNKELRGNSFLLWKKSIELSKAKFPFRTVIESVYHPDEVKGYVSIKM